MRITFTVLGEDQFSRDILRVGERGADMRPAFAMIADDIVEWNAQQFMSQGARASGGWEELAASTVKAKGHDTILIDSSDLFHEMINRSNFMITDSFLHFKPPAEQARIGAFHQSGTVNMPQRRVIEFTELDRRQMVRRMQAWALDGRLI